MLYRLALVCTRLTRAGFISQTRAKFASTKRSTRICCNLSRLFARRTSFVTQRALPFTWFKWPERDSVPPEILSLNTFHSPVFETETFKPHSSHCTFLQSRALQLLLTVINLLFQKWYIYSYSRRKCRWTSGTGKWCHFFPSGIIGNGVTEPSRNEPTSARRSIILQTFKNMKFSQVYIFKLMLI